jgi:hypothetical protein
MRSPCRISANRLTRARFGYIFSLVASSVCASYSLAESGSNRMAVDPANAHELTRTASKTGVDALTGHLRDPSETAGRQRGDPHFREHFDRCRDQPMRLMTVPVCQAVPATWACGICDLLFSRRGECLWRCIASPSRWPSRGSTRSLIRTAGSRRLPQGSWLSFHQNQRSLVDCRSFGMTKRRFR